MKLDYEPPHLLGLLWFVLRSNRMHPQNSGESELNHHPVRKSRPISAVELKQAGFKLTASTGWFAYMKCQKKKLPFSGELSLSPLFLSENRACGLINMAALESVLATNSESWDMDVYVVSSYLSLLAMLMVREDDVHQLRKSGILISSFSDAQTLDLFKCLSLHLRPGNEFFSTLDEIEWRTLAVLNFLGDHHDS
ncbi:hypothetical protein HU200_028510 [Digitaria exilis]|uniref:Uncharacterized protein n=1 Tax=Digitaria exilis TaxID=1010633 RepID=A0A835C5Q2_9POAL|nr:hypothetical protein HU200_028510 [Digitaria exilis]